MENREQQILSEIKAMMVSIRVQLEKLDDKMAELQQVVDPEDVAAEPIDLEIETSLLEEKAPEVVIQEIPLRQESVVEERRRAGRDFTGCWPYRRSPRSRQPRNVL